MRWHSTISKRIRSVLSEGGAVIRFAPIDIDKQQYASVHGENENISVEKIHLTVDFYRELIGKYK